MNNELQLMELFHQISKKMWKLLMPIFREKQLSIAEISVLMRMRRKPSYRATELATMIGIPTSTVTGILDRLEQRGFLERSPDPNDRRSFQITVTPKIGEFMRELKAPMEGMLRKAFRSMPDSRIQRLIQDLQFILNALEQQDTASDQLRWEAGDS